MPDDAIAAATSPLGLLTDAAWLDLANQLYRTYHARCFWHCPRDLIITAEYVPMVIAGLRKHGGRDGFILSAKLRRRGE